MDQFEQKFLNLILKSNKESSGGDIFEDQKLIQELIDSNFKDDLKNLLKSRADEIVNQ